jgi:hypothetical protein
MSPTVHFLAWLLQFPGGSGHQIPGPRSARRHLVQKPDLPTRDMTDMATTAPSNQPASPSSVGRRRSSDTTTSQHPQPLRTPPCHIRSPRSNTRNARARRRTRRHGSHATTLRPHRLLVATGQCDGPVQRRVPEHARVRPEILAVPSQLHRAGAVHAPPAAREARVGAVQREDGGGNWRRRVEDRGGLAKGAPPAVCREWTVEALGPAESAGRVELGLEAVDCGF